MDSSTASSAPDSRRSVFDWRVPPEVAANPTRRPKPAIPAIPDKPCFAVMRLADGSMVGAITFKDVAGAVRFLSQRLIEHPNGSDPFRFERILPDNKRSVGSSIRPDTTFIVDYADGSRRLCDTFDAARAACGFRLLRGRPVDGLSRKERIVKSAQGMYGFELISVVDGYTGKLTVFVRQLNVQPVDPDVIESEEAAIDRQLAAEVAAIDAQLAADLTELDARYAAEVAAMETPEADTPPPAYRDSSQPLARDPSAAV